MVVLPVSSPVSVVTAPLLPSEVVLVLVLTLVPTPVLGSSVSGAPVLPSVVATLVDEPLAVIVGSSEVEELAPVGST
jgi:hypothetical protein